MTNPYRYKSMPKPIKTVVGSKVSWKTYATIDEAMQAASVARHNAEIDEAMGYDFGFMSPGEIKKTDEGYEVVCS